MVVSLDVIPGVAFITLWFSNVAGFWRIRRIWANWVSDPVNDPEAAADVRVRGALRKVFEKYEEERQVIADRELDAAIDDLDVSAADFEDDEVDDWKRVRRKLVSFFRSLDENVATMVAPELSGRYAATKQARFGEAIKGFETSARLGRRIRRRHRFGAFLVIAGLGSMIAALVCAVIFALAEVLSPTAFGVTATSTGNGLILVLAWGSLVISFVVTLLLRELTLRPVVAEQGAYGGDVGNAFQSKGFARAGTMPPNEGDHNGG